MTNPKSHSYELKGYDMKVALVYSRALLLKPSHDMSLLTHHTASQMKINKHLLGDNLVPDTV